MAGVMYQGRRVSAHWFNRYVKGKLAPQREALEATRYALFFLPEIINEPAETRLVGFRSTRDRQWIESISADYAALDPMHLTTFFPYHP